MDFIEDLQWRGLLADCTDLAELGERLQRGPITLYCGFDPTADSLHVGHLVGQLTLRRFQLAGHNPLPLAGGATGMIGDPSGKSAERNLLTREELEHNVSRIKGQLSRLLDFDHPVNPARLVDNADWTAGLTCLEFLREVGKHFTVNVMMQKESVRARMDDRETGISYTEFSYMLLQANDFYHLRRTMDCELQIGGTDQWGNITAGTDLIRRKLGVPAWGLVFPLITRADGTKFGKTEAGTVWLDPERTSPYRFYQFFINSEDRTVIDYLKKFTFLSREEIENLAREHESNPGSRSAHRTLAGAVTGLVHGPDALDATVKASNILFGGGLVGVTERVFNEVVGEIPTHVAPPGALDGEGALLPDLAVLAGLSPSKSQARKDIEGGGIYINNVREADSKRRVKRTDLLFNKHLLLRKGKRSYAVLTLAEA